MKEIGLRELRQHASDFVRQAEAGESMTITVSGRPAAVLGPVSRSAWRSFDHVAGIFTTPSDPDWASDLGGFDQPASDPWSKP